MSDRLVKLTVLVPKDIVVRYGSRGFFCEECRTTEALDYTPEDPNVVEEMAWGHAASHVPQPRGVEEF